MTKRYRPSVTKPLATTGLDTLDQQRRRRLRGAPRDLSGALGLTVGAMCRNIRQLNNFEPPATSAEVQAAALQFVRKVSGMNKPSKANEQYFDEAVHDIAHITQHLLDHLTTSAPPKNREEEAAKARARSAARFAS